MSRYGSTWPGRRKHELPSNWHAIRTARFAADGFVCTIEGCRARATDCDHVGHRDDHRHEMLRSKCSDHHDEHTRSQAASAWSAIRRGEKRLEDASLFDQIHTIDND